MPSDSHTPSFVTHAEFGEFKRNTEGSLSRIENALGRVNVTRSTNWGNLAAWVGVSLTILTLVVTPVAWLALDTRTGVADLDDRSRARSDMVARHDERIERALAKIANTDDRLSAIDVVLQRELNLVNQTTEVRLQGLDRTLQVEMKLLNDGVKSELLWIKRELDRLTTGERLRYDANNKKESNP